MKNRKLLTLSILILLISYFHIYSQDTNRVFCGMDVKDEKEVKFQRYINFGYFQEAQDKIVQPIYLNLGFALDDSKSPLCLEFGMNAAVKKGADSIYEKFSVYITPCFKIGKIFTSNNHQLKIGLEFGAGIASGIFKVNGKNHGYAGINALSKIFYGFIRLLIFSLQQISRCIKN